MPDNLTPQRITDIFSRSRIPAPKEIILPVNMTMYSGDPRYKGRKVLGLQKTGDNGILVPSSSPQRTVLHEATHNIGIRGETPTRIVAALANMRLNYGILPRLHRRKVRYRSEMVPDEQVGAYMQHYGLSGDHGDMKIIRMVLEE